MKRIFLILTALAVMASANIFALGIGPQFGYNAGPNSTGDVALTFKVDKVPFVFAANLAFDSKRFGLGLTADNWVVNPVFIQAPFRWYIGWGLYGNFVFGDQFGLSVGARLPLGINAFFLKGFVEPYLQIAPSIGISILPKLNFPDWFIPINLGVRFWIKTSYNQTAPSKAKK